MPIPDPNAERLARLTARFPADVQAYFDEALIESPPLAIQTLLGYAYDFRIFWDYYLTPRGLSLRDVTPDVIRGFIAFLRRGYSVESEGRRRTYRVNSERTLARKKASLRTIFQFLTQQRNLYEQDPTLALDEVRTRRRKGRVRQELPVYLSQQETRRLKEVARSGSRRYEADQRLNLRDFAIVSLFLGTGMRVSELISLTFESFDDDGAAIRVVGKGNKIRVIPLSSEVQRVLASYLAERARWERVHPDHRSALFLNRQGRPLTRKGVYDVVRRFCDRAGIYPQGKHVSPHKLRHTAATNWYRRGLDLYMLQQVLGHANPQTTEIYTHVIQKEIADAIRRLPPDDTEIS